MAIVSTPAVARTDRLSQAELLKRIDPQGNLADIAEVLNESNEVIQDVVLKELEVVVDGYVLRGKDATANALSLEASEVEVDGLILVETDVSDRQHDRTILSLSC